MDSTQAFLLIPISSAMVAELGSNQQIVSLLPLARPAMPGWTPARLSALINKNDFYKDLSDTWYGSGKTEK